jgi:hypothetical protein
VLAGFGVVRFLKSSANDSEAAAGGSQQTGQRGFAENTARTDLGYNRSNAANKKEHGHEFTR